MKLGHKYSGFIGLALFFLFISCKQQKDLIVVHLAGDSTMAIKTADRRPETGWGEKLAVFFEKNVSIANHAKNGRSTKTFREEGFWQGLLDSCKQGDFVLIQFGHNDAKINSERYASPADYKNNIREFVREIRAHKAEPILLTPVVRRRFDSNGVFYDTHGEYPVKVRELAEEENIALVDMHLLTGDHLKKLGPENSKKLFLWLEDNESQNYPEGVEDNTHFNDHGAMEAAELFIKALTGMHHPLSLHLKQ